MEPTVRRDMKVSIIINNYNYGHFLGAAIDSALAQSYAHTEVVVVDDGSTDDSREVIAGYGDRIRSIMKTNGGQASAFNAGFAASEGDVICLLDSDDFFYPNKVEQVVKAITAYPDVRWVFHPICRIFQDGRTTSKFLAVALSPGIYLHDVLAAQRIHGANHCTMRRDQTLQARVHLLIAQNMRRRFPQLSLLSNHVFAKSFALYATAFRRDSICEATIKDYLRSTALLEMPDLLLRAGYHTVPIGFEHRGLSPRPSPSRNSPTPVDPLKHQRRN
jgi:glycosyltransferase involved in cell wall biosynthesis